MARHAPPTNRSFYLSVATSTVRFILIAALVAGGVLVINQAFPETASGGGTAPVPTGGGGPAPTGSPTPTGATGETTQPPANVPSPTITGTRVAVFNTTGVSGLAADVMAMLLEDGYVQAQEPADAPASPVTRIFYRAAKDRVEAEYIANEYFRRFDVVPAKLQPGDEVNRDVQVAIYIGNDYAASVD
jgi:hypothetical protein